VLIPEKIKRLEALVLEASRAIKDLRSANNKLLRANKGLLEDNDRLKAQIQRLSRYPVIQRRLRDRLEKIIHKLDKIK
jgi:regulator of replication initiation timing